MSLLRAHKSVFEVVRNALDANPAMSHIKASIGTRFQAEQNPEVIIQQNSFDVNDLNTQDFNTFEISVYCYSNSYTEAASVADHLFNAVRDNEYYILTETEDIEGSSEVNVSTTPYHLRGLDLFLEYYDEDGYEANILIRAIEAADTVTGVGTPDTGGRPAPFFPQSETRIQDLSDVNVSTLAEGNILKYDFSEGEWVNGSLPILTTGSLTQSELNGYTILSINETASFTNITLSNDISVSGDLLFSGGTSKLIRPLDIGGAAGPLTIQSNGDLVIELDENADEPNKAFIVKNGGDAEVFKVDESGNVTVNQQYILPTTDGNANYFLKTDGSGQLYFATLHGTSGNTGGAPPPAIDTITELLDTQVSSLADNQILRYDSVSSKWVNEDLTLAQSIGDLTDVDTTTVAPTDGQALVWDNAASQFVPGDSFSQSDFDTAFGNKNLSNLGDVDSSLPSDSSVLAWDATNNYWEPRAASSGSSSYVVYATARTNTNGTTDVINGMTVSRSTTGTYNYTFTTALSDANYVVTTTPVGYPSTDANIYVDNFSSTGFTVYGTSGDNGTSTDPLIDREHCVTVFSSQSSGGGFVMRGDDGDQGPSGTTYDVVTLTGSTTLSSAHTTKYLVVDSASNCNLTVPATASYDANAEFVIEQRGAGIITVVAASGVTINTSETLVSGGQYAVMGLKRTASNVYTLTGERQAS